MVKPRYLLLAKDNKDDVLIFKGGITRYYSDQNLAVVSVGIQALDYIYESAGSKIVSTSNLVSLFGVVNIIKGFWMNKAELPSKYV